MHLLLWLGFVLCFFGMLSGSQHPVAQAAGGAGALAYACGALWRAGANIAAWRDHQASLLVDPGSETAQQPQPVPGPEIAPRPHKQPIWARVRLDGSCIVRFFTDAVWSSSNLHGGHLPACHTFWIYGISLSLERLPSCPPVSLSSLLEEGGTHPLARRSVEQMIERAELSLHVAEREVLERVPARLALRDDRPALDLTVAGGGIRVGPLERIEVELSLPTGARLPPGEWAVTCYLWGIRQRGITG